MIATIEPEGMRRSPPSRGRGLKLDPGRRESPIEVAPFAGAWIETSSGSRTSLRLRVAPFAGAWIET